MRIPRSPRSVVASWAVSRAQLGLAFFLAIATPMSAAGLMDAQRMLKVEGQPRFILGLYENPKDDAVLREAVESGFNLIQCGADLAALDRLQKLGAKAWVNLGGALDLSSDTAKRAAQLQETVKRVGGHPALLLWEGPDEILWNQWWSPMETLRAELNTMQQLAETQTALGPLSRLARNRFDRGLYAEFQEARAAFWQKAGQACPHPTVRVDDAPQRVDQVGDGITAGVRLVRKLDPHHLVWLNHAPRNALTDLRRFNRAADVVGCDIYPVPANLEVTHSDLPDLGLTSVGAYTDRMRQAGPGKACAMVLQGFGWRDLRAKVNEHQIALGIGRRPTFTESRFMAYDAILHGANAVLYWGTAHMKPVEDNGTAVTGRPRLWSDLMKLGRELRALEPALVAAPCGKLSVRLDRTYGSVDGAGILASLRRVGDDDVLIVVNEARDGLGFTMGRLPGRLNGRTLYRLQTQDEHKVTGSQLRDGIRPMEVHVYATSRRFEPAPR